MRVTIAMLLFSSFFGRNENEDSDTARTVSEAALLENITNQATLTPVTLEQLSQFGVTDDSLLALEFFFYTDTQAKATALAEALLAEGYSAEHGPSADDETILVITGWSTKMRMDEATVIDWTKRMCQIGFDHDCMFDGWGTYPNQD